MSLHLSPACLLLSTVGQARHSCRHRALGSGFTQGPALSKERAINVSGEQQAAVSLASSLVRRKQAGLGMDEEGACDSDGFRAVQEGGSLERTAGSDGLGLRGKGPVKRKSKALVGDGFSVRNKEPRAAGESGGCQGCQETSS